jgi:hypothetical protein
MRKLILFLIFIPLFYSNSLAGENQFQIGIGFEYENTVAQLKELSSSKNSIPDDITSEDIDQYNDQFKFYNQIYFTGLDLSYSFLGNFKATLSTGIAFMHHESFFREEDLLESSFNSSKPGYFGGFGIEYRKELSEKISMKFSPNISYFIFPELHHITTEFNNSQLENASLKHTFIKYNIPIIFQYDFGFIKPGLGVCYYDYHQKIDYDGTFVDDFEDEYLIEREYGFKQNSVIAGIAYLEIIINENSTAFIQSRFSENISASISFQFGI